LQYHIVINILIIAHQQSKREPSGSSAFHLNL